MSSPHCHMEGVSHSGWSWHVFLYENQTDVISAYNMYDGRETRCSVLYAFHLKDMCIYSFFYFCTKAHYFLLVLFSMRTVYKSCTYACKCRRTEKHCIECTFKELKPNTTVWHLCFIILHTCISRIVTLICDQIKTSSKYESHTGLD